MNQRNETSSAEDLERWNEVARNYIVALEGGELSSSWHLQDFIERHLPDMTRSRVLDVGCGHGWLTARLHSQGAIAVGIDGSGRFIELAKARHPDCEFVQFDLTRGLGPCAERQFDALVARFSLMCIRDIDLLIRDARACLSSGGVFLVTMPHPCFYPHERVQDDVGGHYRRVTGYLNHAVISRPDFGGHNYFHRPLSWYVGKFREHGFLLTDMEEPRQVPDTARGRPLHEWTDYERWWSSISTFIGLAFVPCGPVD